MSHVNNQYVLKNKMDRERERVEMTYQNEDDHRTQSDFSTNRQQPLQRSGRKAKRIRCYRAATVCLVALCVLLTAVIVLCALNNHLFHKTSENGLWEILNEADGWIYYQSNFYYISSEKMTWRESRRYCKEKKSDLIIINNREEQNFVQKMAGTEYIWIGLSDGDGEGRWKWVDGTTLTSEFWRSGEPNGHKKENCVEYYSSGWNDLLCDKYRKWICERNILK